MDSTVGGAYACTLALGCARCEKKFKIVREGTKVSEREENVVPGVPPVHKLRYWMIISSGFLDSTAVLGGTVVTILQ